MPMSTRSDSFEPMGPNVTANMMNIMSRNSGMAVYLPVTMRSMRSVTVGSSALRPRLTDAETTDSM